MRFTVIMLSLAVSVPALANTEHPLQRAQSSKAAPQVQLDVTQAKTFDSYQFVPELIAISKNVPSNGTTVAQMGTQRVVEVQGATSRTLQAQSVVRNLMTGQLGVMTGRISVISNNPALLQAQAQQLGLKVVHTLNDGELTLLQAPSASDLLQLRQTLSQVAGVRAVRLDVLEKRYSAQ